MNKGKIINAKDAAAIMSSSESETFETWTLVTPKSSSNPKSDKSVNLPNVQEANECRIEKIKKDESHTDGELSDGISVISDSESAGRASPQPAPRRTSPVKRINAKKCDLNENDSDNPESIQDAEQYTPITSSRTPDYVDLSASEATATESTLQLPIETELRMGINFKYIFYCAAFIAFIAFLRTIKIPDFEDKALHSKIDALGYQVREINEINHFLRDKLNQLSEKINPSYEFKIDEREFSEEECKIIKLRDRKGNEDSEYLMVAPDNGGPGRITKICKSSLCEDESSFVDNSDDFITKFKNFLKFVDKKLINFRYQKPNTRKTNLDQNQPQKTSEDPNQDNEYEIRKNNKRKFENHANNDRKYEESKPERTSRRIIKEEDDWHEKMMRNREEIRKQHEPYARRDGGSADDSNWYLERGHGRRDARKPEKREKRS